MRILIMLTCLSFGCLFCKMAKQNSQTAQAALTEEVVDQGIHSACWIYSYVEVLNAAAKRYYLRSYRSFEPSETKYGFDRSGIDRFEDLLAHVRDQNGEMTDHKRIATFHESKKMPLLSANGFDFLIQGDRMTAAFRDGRVYEERGGDAEAFDTYFNSVAVTHRMIGDANFTNATELATYVEWMGINQNNIRNRLEVLNRYFEKRMNVAEQFHWRIKDEEIVIPLRDRGFKLTAGVNQKVWTNRTVHVLMGLPKPLRTLRLEINKPWWKPTRVSEKNFAELWSDASGFELPAATLMRDILAALSIHNYSVNVSVKNVDLKKKPIVIINGKRATPTRPSTFIVPNHYDGDARADIKGHALALVGIFYQGSKFYLKFKNTWGSSRPFLYLSSIEDIRWAVMAPEFIWGEVFAVFRALRTKSCTETKNLIPFAAALAYLQERSPRTALDVKSYRLIEFAKRCSRAESD